MLVLNTALTRQVLVSNTLYYPPKLGRAQFNSARFGFNRPKPTLLDALLAAAEAPPPFSSKLPSQGLK
jgi:hypothetical protein